MVPVRPRGVVAGRAPRDRTDLADRWANPIDQETVCASLRPPSQSARQRLLRACRGTPSAGAGSAAGDRRSVSVSSRVMHVASRVSVSRASTASRAGGACSAGWSRRVSVRMRSSRRGAAARERGVAPLLGVVMGRRDDHGGVEGRRLGEVAGDGVGVFERAVARVGVG